jgi:hypothetical protein
MERQKVIGVLLLIFALLNGKGTGGGSAPFPTDKLSVMVVYDPSDAALVALPQAQRGILNSTGWTKLVPDGHWRVYPEGTPVEGDEPWSKAAMGLKREVLPWVGISTGKSGYTGNLPENEAAMSELIKRYGGA